ALALIVGLALGVGVAFLRERLDDRLRSQSDFEERIGSPVLATIPHIRNWRAKRSPRLVSMEDPTGSSAEAYRVLRTYLQFTGRNGDFQVLSVTSPRLGEGKTTTVANLAVALALSGKQVLAVSCDLRNPRLHRFFGLQNEFGVTSVLAGETTFEEAVQPAGVDGLRFLSSG